MAVRWLWQTPKPLWSCVISSNSARAKHIIIRKNPKNNQRGTAAVRQSYFKRFSYSPQLFLTKTEQENKRIDICFESYRSIIKSRHWENCATKRSVCTIVRLSRIWMRNFWDDTFYISVAITTMAIVLGIAYPFVVLYSNKSIVYIHLSISINTIAHHSTKEWVITMHIPRRR